MAHMSGPHERGGTTRLGGCIDIRTWAGIGDREEVLIHFHFVFIVLIARMVVDEDKDSMLRSKA